jgi:hypothetical protein
MSAEEQLVELERRLKEHFGAWTRYLNDLFTQKPTTTADRIAIATAILRAPDRGIAGMMYEANRQRELGRPDDWQPE